MTNAISYLSIKREFLNFLRNSDVLSTATRGVTTKTDTSTAVGGAETFTLSVTNCKNVRWVKQNGTALVYGTDYTLGYSISSTTYGNILTVVVSKSLTLGDAITIRLDYGTGDKIYADYPRDDITISSFPRIAFDIYGLTSETAGFGNVNKTTFRFMIDIYDAKQTIAEGYMDSLRTAIIAAQNSFYTFAYIKPVNVRQVEQIEFTNSKIYKIGIDTEQKNNYEIN